MAGFFPTGLDGMKGAFRTLNSPGIERAEVNLRTVNASGYNQTLK